jgi:hypothetical protein
MSIFSRLLLTVAAVATVVTAGALAAQADQQTVADEQASLVEDFSYPGADAIFAANGLTLVSGDGHILHADCATPPTGNIGLVRIRTTETIGNQGLVCFKVTATTGRLELRVPAVYEIRGDGLVAGAGHKMKADLTTEAGVRSSVVVNPSGNTPVGVGDQPPGPPTTLLQLVAAP